MIELGRSEAIELLATLEEAAPVVLAAHLLALLLAVEDGVAVLVSRLFPGRAA